MCGIAAIFGHKQRPEVFACLQKMTSIIRHRGPDDEGYVVFGKNPAYQQFFAGPDTPQEVLNSPFSLRA